MTRKSRSDQRRHHILYRTTCLISGRYYIGIHSTDDMNDGRLGSGKQLGYSIKKHGRENHVREVLEEFSNRADLVAREHEVVDGDMLKDPMCMNIMRGGNATALTFP